ncbi:MAG: BamA/TamA family outer membrane protein [Bacteroidales bacterium]|nr:BamA/TamA family outer membrane protein [Bacteroidales bacterium]
MRSIKLSRNFTIYILCSVTLVVAETSCNPARYVPNQKYLLKSVNIVKDEGELSVRELNHYVKQQPNKKIFGFLHFHLALYNLSKSGRNNWLNNWLRTIGEAPVCYDENLTKRSIDQLRLFLYNKGYRQSHVSDSVVFEKKKAQVYYRIHFGKPLTLNRRVQLDSLLIPDPEIYHLVQSDTIATLLQPGIRFDLDVLQNERKRITALLQNSGYYNFSREYIYFQADTSVGANKVNLSLGIQNPGGLSDNKGKPGTHPRYRMGKITVISDYQPSEYLKDPDHYFDDTDTLQYEDIDILFKHKPQFRPGLLYSSLYFNKGDLFRQTLVDQTIKSFSSLRNFKQINLNFIPKIQADHTMSTLDCQVLLTPATRQSYELSLEGTNSSGNIGVAGNIIYRLKNLFHGAENLEVRIKSAVEFLADAVADFNRMIEIGAEARLDVPRSWIPFASPQLIRRAKPHSSFTLSYNFQQRPDFTRTIANAGFGYVWMSSPHLSHRFNFLEFNYVNVTNMSDRFYNIIRDTYIENSFRSHVIPALNYTLTLSSQEVDQQKSFFFIRFRPEISGNVPTLLNHLAGKSMPDGGYSLFKTPYAQYALADLDMRYHWVVNSSNRFAFRVFAGAGYPYGNANALPFEKKYFSGGSNSIRAWQVRSLGPGSYQLPEDQKTYYPNQLGDLKMEFNMEYRFDLFWLLEGALFIDAGNIWALHHADERSGARFVLNRFYKEIAVGTGLGIRLDLSFILARLDLGIKLREPGSPNGPQWIPGNRPYRWSDFVWNFGIGYPF